MCGHEWKYHASLRSIRSYSCLLLGNESGGVPMARARWVALDVSFTGPSNEDSLAVSTFGAGLPRFVANRVD